MATATSTVNLHKIVASETTTGKPRKQGADMEFSLSEEEMKKINYLGKLERKKHRHRGVKDSKQNKFSDQLSLEAQIAMQLALKDTQAMKKADNDDAGMTSQNRNRNANNHVKFADEQTINQVPPRPETQCSKHSSFSGTFEKRGSARMSSDITDENFEPHNVSKRSLDGTKVEVAMETVEIVDGDAERHIVDDDVIEQIAQRNSVEKCLVWMEVLAKEGQLPSGASKNAAQPDQHKSKSARSNRTHEYQSANKMVTPGH